MIGGKEERTQRAFLPSRTLGTQRAVASPVVRTHSSLTYWSEHFLDDMTHEDSVVNKRVPNMSGGREGRKGTSVWGGHRLIQMVGEWSGVSGSAEV